MVNRWDDIEETVAHRGAGPWFIAVLDRSLREIPV